MFDAAIVFQLAISLIEHLKQQPFLVPITFTTLKEG